MERCERRRSEVTTYVRSKYEHRHENEHFITFLNKSLAKDSIRCIHVIPSVRVN